jgi:hypothetical protein
MAENFFKIFVTELTQLTVDFYTDKRIFYYTNSLKERFWKTLKINRFSESLVPLISCCIEI